MSLTNELHKVLIFVPDPASVLADYDSILVSKSTTGPNGDFQAILSSSPRPAEITGTKPESFDMNGKSLEFYADGIGITVPFTVETTAAQVANQITVFSGYPANDQGGYVRIRSNTSGLYSTMEIRNSTEGGVELGMYEGTEDMGEGQWIPLQLTQRLYVQDDPHSSNDYWYKYVFINSGTGIYSEPSIPFKAQPLGAIDPTNLIYGTGVIADTAGNPVAGKRIIVYNRFIPTVVAGALVDGPQTAIYETDEEGLISIPFVHGSKISIGIEDTKLRRDIDVPTSGDSFDIFDQTLLDDRLGIVYYPIIDAERTTL